MILSQTDESSDDDDDPLAPVEAENPENEVHDNSELESAIFSSARDSTLALSVFTHEDLGERLISDNGGFSEDFVISVLSIRDFSSLIPWRSGLATFLRISLTKSSVWLAVLGG
jgi:hypothetical protein